MGVPWWLAWIIKNLPAVQKTWFDPWPGRLLEKGMAAHSSISPSPWNTELDSQGQDGCHSEWA